MNLKDFYTQKEIELEQYYKALKGYKAAAKYLKDAKEFFWACAEMAEVRNHYQELCSQYSEMMGL